MVTPRESSKKIAVNKTLLLLDFFLLLIVSTIPKIFNANIYRFFGFVVNIFIQIIIVYGLLGHITQSYDEIDVNTKCQILFAIVGSVMIQVMFFTMLNKSNDMLGLVSMLRIDFFTSMKCCQHDGIFKEYLILSIQIAYVFVFLIVICVISWITFPFLINVKQRNEISVNGHVRRYENVFNFQFPVSTIVFNDYYLIFYAMEITVLIYFTVVNMVYNVFFTVISTVLIGQYEVIKRAFEDVSHELEIDENVDGKYYYIFVS